MNKIKEQYEEIMQEEKSIKDSIGSDAMTPSFEEFQNIVDRRLSEIPACNLFNKINDDDLEPYVFLLKLNIAFHSAFYNGMIKKFDDDLFFRGINNRKSDTDLFLTLLWKENLSLTISATTLFLLRFRYQVEQLLRLYIESSSLLFLSMTNYDFLTEYISENLTEKEYKNIWWKKLSPSKVSKAIEVYQKKINDQIVKDKNKGIRVPYLHENNILDSKYINNLYASSSDFVHFKKRSLYSSSYVYDEKGFDLAICRFNSKDKKQTLVTMIELFTQTTRLLTITAELSHIGVFYELSSEEWPLSVVHSTLAVKCSHTGMYEYAGFH